MSFSDRLESLTQQISHSMAQGPLTSSAKPPIIIGASKTQPITQLQNAIHAGLTHFGENRVQEAQEKWPTLRAAHPDITLHLIGPLQSNKAKEAVALFDVIHTLDRPKLADALKHAMHAQDKSCRLLVQVNTGEEPQKAGVIPQDLPPLLAYCAQLHLPIVGLMCIPPADLAPAPHFALLRQLAERHHLPELSMGMSEDAAIAARFGATMVRVGRHLFGERTG